MKYKNTIRARFVSRPNRFTAIVEIPGDSSQMQKLPKPQKLQKPELQEPKRSKKTQEFSGYRDPNQLKSAGLGDVAEDESAIPLSEPAAGWRRETVHVKNTGRCRELLIPGAAVILEKSENPDRKTKYDLIAVYKEGLGLVNMDSQAPNKVVREWLLTKDYDLIKPEYAFGESRIDFYMEKGEQKYLMEVKGCTLEIDGVGYFPDAPTQRGVKHLKELAKAARQGYICYAAFVIQMEGVDEVRPNVETHPQFAEALAEAKEAGVRVICLGCSVGEDELVIDRWKKM